jgi:hypothetical protein
MFFRCILSELWTVIPVFGIFIIHASRLLKDEVFILGDVPDASATSLALRRHVIGIEDLVLRVQGRDCMQAPVDIWHVLLVKSEDSVITSFRKFILNNAQQDHLFGRGMTNKVLDFMHLGAVLYAVLDPDQVLHVADGALQLRQKDALVDYSIVQDSLSKLSIFHEDVF